VLPYNIHNAFKSFFPTVKTQMYVGNYILNNIYKYLILLNLNNAPNTTRKTKSREKR